MERIEFFEGEFGFLSNFYPSEIDGPEGVKCATVEHAFQAEKSNRPAERRKIASAPSPGAAKRSV